MSLGSHHYGAIKGVDKEACIVGTKELKKGISRELGENKHKGYIHGKDEVL